MADCLQIDFSLLFHLCTFKTEMSIFFSMKMEKVKLWMNPQISVFISVFIAYLRLFLSKDMRTITREQAICMLYCVSITMKMSTFISTIDALKSVEICYKDGHVEPILISLKSLEAHTAKYRKYPSTVQSLEKKQ